MRTATEIRSRDYVKQMTFFGVIIYVKKKKGMAAGRVIFALWKQTPKLNKTFSSLLFSIVKDAREVRFNGKVSLL